ncbi:MAG TPA: Ig-like domain-containing protein, partial [Jatrophihabitantaceae bacterium]
MLAVAAAALTAAIVLSACSSGSSKDDASTPAPSSSSQAGAATSGGATTPSSSASKTSAKPKPTSPVHVSLFQGDGQTWGIGMAIQAQFSKKITDARPFNKAVTVRVNGHPANGAWFWVNSNNGYAMEAQYRLQKYWPAHSKVEMNMPLKGVSAGPGLAFDDSLTLSF